MLPANHTVLKDSTLTCSRCKESPMSRKCRNLSCMAPLCCPASYLSQTLCQEKCARRPSLPEVSYTNSQTENSVHERWDGTTWDTAARHHLKLLQ
eukprot:3741831-Amphidinium_carterae.1